MEEIMTTTTPNTIVEAARETLREKHRQHVTEAKAKFETRCEAEWARAEAQRKADFIEKYRLDFAPTFSCPYANISDAAAVRLVTPAEDRYRVLAEHRYFEELLYTWLARNKRKATVDQAKMFFAEYFPTEGNSTITEDLRASGGRVVIHATKLSKPLSDLLVDAFGVKVKFGRITWNPGQQIDPSEY
jgi:hypothetical protein